MLKFWIGYEIFSTDMAIRYIVAFDGHGLSSIKRWKCMYEIVIRLMDSYSPVSTYTVHNMRDKLPSDTKYYFGQFIT